MADRQTKTTKLPKGGDYAFVADRLKEFRQDCPNGLIETKPTISDDSIIFEVRILKDKSKPESAESMGHAYNKLGAAKVFEKTETQALGRALALLGYMASGEIASAEEMEEYNAYKEQQKIEAVTIAVEMLNDATSLEELKATFMTLGTAMRHKEVIQAKDKRKAELSK